MISTPPEVGQFVRIDFKNGTQYAVVHRLFDDAFSVKVLSRAAAKTSQGFLFRYNNKIDMEICNILPGRPSKEVVAATYPSLTSSVADEELEQLKADAARYRHIRDNHVWARHGEEGLDGYAFVGLKFEYDTDFSCKAMLDYHIDKAIKS